MRRRTWGWAGGTVAALLLAAWVSGAGSVSAFTVPGQSPPATEEFGELVEADVGDNRMPGGARAPLEGNETVAAVVAWTLRVLLVVVVVVAVILVVRQLVLRLRRDPVTVKDEVRAGLLPDVLVAGIRESEAELDRGESGEAVINAWLTLERSARAVGIGDDAARTPAELVTAVLDEHAVDPAAIERLAALYREARFSEHPIGEQHREAARDALRTVREDLLRPLAALGEAPRR